MKNKKNNNGFSLVELMIVLIIIIVGVALAFWGLHTRASHFRLTGSTRDFMGQLKLAQASAIRANTRYRLGFPSDSAFKFQVWDTGAADFVDTASTDGPLYGENDENGSPTGQTALEMGITFVIGNPPCAAIPCAQAIVFNSDGTLNSQVSNMELTDGSESYLVNWTLGGSIRITPKP